MEPIPCLHCGIYFIPRNRCQGHCSKKVCQKARKATWQRFKMKTDPDYRSQQKLSNQKWLESNPDYWIQYRHRHPEKVIRNRALQHIRNRRQRKLAQCHSPLIAKMDARNPIQYQLVGQFYMVPLIAKMDVRKVYIFTISTGYG